MAVFVEEFLRQRLVDIDRPALLLFFVVTLLVGSLASAGFVVAGVLLIGIVCRFLLVGESTLVLHSIQQRQAFRATALDRHFSRSPSRSLRVDFVELDLRGLRFGRGFGHIGVLHGGQEPVLSLTSHQVDLGGKFVSMLRQRGCLVRNVN